MSEHRPRTAERHCDVAVIGGSAAGLAAALQLGRQRRSVIVIDAGEPRNAPAARMHSYLGHEGIPPADLTGIGRAEVRSYGTEIISGRAVDVTRADDGRFRVELEAGHFVVARRVLAATGLVDELPDIDGLAEHWGRDVIHCPFCHGFEVRDLPVVQIVTHPMGLHPAVLFRQLTSQLTLVLHEGVESDYPEIVALRDAGVAVVDRRVRRVITGTDGRVAAVELADGEQIEAKAIAVSARFRARAEAFASLGLHPAEHPSGLGDYIEADPTGATSVPGLSAAGSLVEPNQQVLHAAANGSRIGAMISFSLASEDVEAASRPSAGESDWDHRYRGETIWSGNPNGTLVHEVTSLSPGRALDVGAGEGGDAIWLAEQGWKVTASDISSRALERTTAEAKRRGLSIERLHTDANALDAFGTDTYDLVSAQYVPIPRSPDGRGARNLVDAVAPGGTLVIVNHDLEPHRSGDKGTSMLFDADAFVSIDDIVVELSDESDWKIEVHEKRARPSGHASMHVDDIVLRARRLAD